MERILLLTDFSERSANAINYALQLFKDRSVRFYLFHSYHISAGGNAGVLSIDEIVREDSQKRLNAMLRGLEQNYPDFQFDTILARASLIEGIENVIRDKNIDCLVMGTHGTSVFEEIFLMSKTSHILDKIKIPMWLVPENAGFKQIENIIFSSDYEQIHVDETLRYLKDFVIESHANLKVLHIKLDEDEAPTPEHLLESHVEAEFFRDVHPAYKVVVHKDVEQGIESYLNKHPEVNLLTMVNHERGFFGKFFLKNRTHDLAHHCQTPLLILHEK